MKKVVVVIPVHKSDPTQNELASLRQCYKVLGRYPIRIVAPEGLDMKNYKEATPQCEVVFIAPEWLSSIRQYNKLKISRYFYELFRDYEYLLTYELDAWVFRNELDYWCDKGYDYIGAPWFEGYTNIQSEKLMPGANSGFSLRNIPNTYKLIKRINTLKSMRRFWYKSKFQSLIRFELVVCLLNKFYKIRNTSDLNYLLLQHWGHNEDYFLSAVVPSVFSDYQIAPFEEATHFSFEGNPSFLFRRNNETLPFGCHAWGKYEPVFWKDYIKT